MANIRLHPKTGIYQFRKAVPEDVRDHLREIPDLPGKPGRVEITKSLGTRIKAEANREATRLDALVEAAIEEARQRLARRTAAQAVAATSSASGPPEPIDPRAAFAALNRWEEKAIREAERRLFNTPTQVRLTDADIPRSNLIVALRKRPMWLTKEWMKIDGFDERLAEALRSEGVAATADHPALERLRDEFAGRWEAVLEAEGRMRRGDWNWSDDASLSDASGATPAPQSASAAKSATTVRALLDDYIRELRTGAAPEKTIQDNVRVFARFVEFVGERTEARAVDPSTLRDFRDRALTLPARPASADRDLSMTALQKKYADVSPSARLSRKTVAKWMDFLHAAFEHGCHQDHLEANPVARAKFRRTRNAQAAARTAFTEQDLERIFSSPLFVGFAGPKREHLPGARITWSARYWVMLIAAQTGARINEIGQLHVTDVQHDSAAGIHYFSIAPEAATSDVAAKRLKTASSIRQVPIHTRLIDLGLLDYVEARRSSGTPYLFPDLDHGRTFEPTKNLSRWYGRYLDRIGITDKRLVFHSFRHWMKTALRKARINRDVADYLTGHAPSDVSGRYGGAPPLQERNEVIASLDLGFLAKLRRPEAPELCVHARSLTSRHR